MDTEYDKNIAKWIFCLNMSHSEMIIAKWIFCINMSHSEMISIGVDPQEIISKTAKNFAIIDECENSVLAVHD